MKINHNKKKYIQTPIEDFKNNLKHSTELKKTNNYILHLQIPTPKIPIPDCAVRNCTPRTRRPNVRACIIHPADIRMRFIFEYSCMCPCARMHFCASVCAQYYMCAHRPGALADWRVQPTFVFDTRGPFNSALFNVGWFGCVCGWVVIGFSGGAMRFSEVFSGYGWGVSVYGLSMMVYFRLGFSMNIYLLCVKSIWNLYWFIYII